MSPLDHAILLKTNMCWILRFQILIKQLQVYTQEGKCNKKYKQHAYNTYAPIENVKVLSNTSQCIVFLYGNRFKRFKFIKIITHVNTCYRS